MARARGGFQRKKKAVDDNKAGMLAEKSARKKPGGRHARTGDSND